MTVASRAVRGERAGSRAAGGRPVARRIAVAALSAVLLLAVLETAARLGAFAWHGGSRYHLLFGLHGRTGRIDVSPWSTFTGAHYKFPPRYVLRGALGQGEETAAINSLGFRGPDFSPEKPPGVFRVVCLGESSTFGFHNPDTGTYPFLLETLLRARGGPLRVEVINAGFPYYNTGSILSLLASEVLAYSPDVVTLYAAYNDAGWPLSVGAGTRTLLWLQERSLAWLLLRQHVATDGRVAAAARWVQGHLPWRLDEAGLERHLGLVAARYRRNVTRIVAIARGRGARVVLVKQPMRGRRDRLHLTYDQEYRLVRARFRQRGAVSPADFQLIVHHRLIEELERIAAEERLPLVDNIAIVDADPRRLATYVHLTEEGNLRLAEALRDAIAPVLDRAAAVAAGAAS